MQVELDTEYVNMRCSHLYKYYILKQIRKWSISTIEDRK